MTEENIFLDFLNFGMYTFPLVELEIEGLSQPVPFSVLDPSKNSFEDIKKEVSQLTEGSDPTIKKTMLNTAVSDVYLPTFLLKTGSDSRGISEYLEHLNITCKLNEFSLDRNITNRGIKHTIFTNKNSFIDEFKIAVNQEKMIIVSVKMDSFQHLKQASKLIYKDNISELTHLVCVKKENDSIYILDPLIENASEAVIKTDLDQLITAMTEKRKKSRFIVID